MATTKTTHPVGLCSRARAEYLMGAAAAAGGAIYVGLPDIHGITPPSGGAYLSHGRLPNGEPVPDMETLDPAEVLARLDRVANRREALARRHGGMFAYEARDLRQARTAIAEATGTAVTP